MPAVETTGSKGLTPKRTYQAGAAAMKRGLFVVQGADDNHVVIAGANAAAIGAIEEDTVSAGDPIAIVKNGEAVCQIGAAVSAGAWCKLDANGRLVPSASAGDNIVAKAISSGSNSGDFIVADVNFGTVGAVDSVVNAVASAAIAIQPGTVTLGSGGALAMTLATPATPGDEGKRIFVVAVTAHAHTIVTAANVIKNANASGDTLTFAHVGDGVELEALGGLWYVRSINGPVLSEV